MSGGLVYEYSQEEADYGLVDINDNATVSLRIDFENLQEQYNKLDLDLLQSTDAGATTLKAPKCSEDMISDSGFSKEFDIPKTPEGGAALIRDGVNSDYVRGKLVDVKDTKSPYTVYTTSGAKVKDLEITKLSNDESNTPGGHTTNQDGENGGGDGNADESNAGNEKKKGSASTLSVNGSCGALLVTVFLLVLTYL
jgi:hypothetical protein